MSARVEREREREREGGGKRRRGSGPTDSDYLGNEVGNQKWEETPRSSLANGGLLKGLFPLSERCHTSVVLFLVLKHALCILLTLDIHVEPHTRLYIRTLLLKHEKETDDCYLSEM